MDTNQNTFDTENESFDIDLTDIVLEILDPAKQDFDITYTKKWLIKFGNYEDEILDDDEADEEDLQLVLFSHYLTQQIENPDVDSEYIDYRLQLFRKKIDQYLDELVDGEEEAEEVLYWTENYSKIEKSLRDR